MAFGQPILSDIWLYTLRKILGNCAGELLVIGILGRIKTVVVGNM
jgi:hypothetical protein